jgi:rhodanese-related sulfurtransferase
VLFCASGGRSALALANLVSMGYDAAHIREGFGGYVKAGGIVEKEDDG